MLHTLKTESGEIWFADEKTEVCQYRMDYCGEYLPTGTQFSSAKYLAVPSSAVDLINKWNSRNPNEWKYFLKKLGIG